MCDTEIHADHGTCVSQGINEAISKILRHLYLLFVEVSRCFMPNRLRIRKTGFIYFFFLI